MRISELVTQHILNMLNNQDGFVEIQRNELAEILGCVPSQITYVITSRFTAEQGYKVESRRGGGGCIRISRINMDSKAAIMHIINAVGKTLDQSSAQIMIKNMATRSIITSETANIILAAISERNFADIPQMYRDTLRAAIFKNILLALND